MRVPAGEAEWLFELESFLDANELSNMRLSDYPRTFTTMLLERDNENKPTRRGLCAAVELLSKIAVKAGLKRIMLSQEELTTLHAVALLDAAVDVLEIIPGLIARHYLGDYLKRFLVEQRKEALARSVEFEKFAPSHSAPSTCSPRVAKCAHG
jgi:hypothetical protein